MSRQQWGNGYWNGVKAAETGTVKSKFDYETYAKFAVVSLALSNKQKTAERNLIPLNELYAFLHFCDVDKEDAKGVVDYLKNKKPYGAYLSGNDFVIANIMCHTEHKLLEMREQLAGDIEHL